MPSYLITGASRGLGFEFVRQLSANNENTIIGLVRDKAGSDEKAAELQRTNIHFIKADVANYDALKSTVPEVSKLAGGSLDYIIANAAYMSPDSAFDPMGNLAETPDVLEQDLKSAFNVNVIANVHLFNLYLPLIRKGGAKKIITITSGMADIDLINKFGVDIAGPYSMSKAAMNAAVAKYNAQYGKEGILFLGISPGVVDTNQPPNLTPEQAERAQGMAMAFMQYAPHFKGPVAPESSVKDVLSVIDKASLETGFGGGFVSHFGNKQWL